MPQINLLPWREEVRLRRNKEFGIVAVIAALVMGAVVFAVHTLYQERIDYQQRRNQFLEQQIALLDKKIKAIKDLEKEKEALLARMKIVQELQSSRPEIVHLFDELVRALPEGVYFTKITQRGNRLSIEGVAQSNAFVSALMRRMDKSEWLTDPALVEIKAYQPKGKGKAQGDSALRLSAFKLTVMQTRPKKLEADQEGAS